MPEEENSFLNVLLRVSIAHITKHLSAVVRQKKERTFERWLISPQMRLLCEAVIKV